MFQPHWCLLGSALPRRLWVRGPPCSVAHWFRFVGSGEMRGSSTRISGPKPKWSSSSGKLPLIMRAPRGFGPSFSAIDFLRRLPSFWARSIEHGFKLHFLVVIMVGRSRGAFKGWPVGCLISTVHWKFLEGFFFGFSAVCSWFFLEWTPSFKIKIKIQLPW